MTPHPLVELGGRGPVLLVVPANGFPPYTYGPFAAAAAPDWRAVSLPPRALWPDAGPPPETAGDWRGLADDLRAAIRRHELAPVVAAGHSFGGVVALLAAVDEPALFRGLALLDPTILPPAYMAELREQRRRGEMSFRPLAQNARKRRARFRDHAEAFAYWREKPLFADWSDETVLRYAEAMLRPQPDGGGWTLAWSPEWEAHYYESFYSETWEDLERLDRRLPLLVVRGERSDTYVDEAAALFRERAPWARHVTLPGRGHLFPQAAPEEAGAVVRTWLAASSLSPVPAP